MVRRWWIEEKNPRNNNNNTEGNTLLDRFPPVRIVAMITLLAATLDLIADYLLSLKLSLMMHQFGCTAYRSTIAFLFFFAISVLVYIVQVINSLITFKNKEETRWLCKLTISLQLVCEEVPLPSCLLITFFSEPRLALANPAMVASCIKLVALMWGIVEVIKIKFCWFCFPVTLDHGFTENCNRCWTLKPIHFVMFFVNVCHGVAIGLTIVNIILAASGGQMTPEYEFPPCYSKY